MFNVRHIDACCDNKLVSYLMEWLKTMSIKKNKAPKNTFVLGALKVKYTS